MPSVQFVGRTAVVEAVENRQLTLWGLFQSRQFITSGEGVEALNEFLKKLEPGGAGPIYTLKVYRDGDPEDITDKTECSGSFNFKLTDPNFSGGGLTGVNKSILDRLERIEGRLNGDEDDEDDEDENSLTGIIMGYLKDPHKLATVIGAIKSLSTPGPVPGMLQPGAIGNVERRESPAFAAHSTPEERTNRLVIVLDRLERADPRILDHLEKLADLAETKPDFFKLLLTQLEHGL